MGYDDEQDERYESISCGEVKIARSTEKAFLVVRIEGDDQETWIPKSQLKGKGITLESEVGDEGEMILPMWLAEEKGFV
jgi:hypothetical protein